MQAAVVRPKTGQRIRLKDAFPYPLSTGVIDGQEVTVQEGKVSGGYFVLDESGKLHCIPMQCAELEQVYFVEGKWRREQHPLVVAEFRRRIEELESSRGEWCTGIEYVNESNLEYARKVVEEAEQRASICRMLLRF